MFKGLFSKVLVMTVGISLLTGISMAEGRIAERPAADEAVPRSLMAIFDRIDADGDGVITREEWESFHRDRAQKRPAQPGKFGFSRPEDTEKKPTPEGRLQEMQERIRGYILQFDEDGDKALNLEEFKNLVNDITEKFPQVGERAEKISLNAPEGFGGIAERVFRRFDADEDGRLDEKELARALRMIRAMRQGGRASRDVQGAPDWLRQYALMKFDKDGNGVLEGDELEMMSRDRETRIKRHDSTGDGQLSPEERRNMMLELMAEAKAMGIEVPEARSRQQ